MLTLLIWLIFIVVAIGIAWWILSQVPLPPPMRTVVNVIFGLVALMVVFWLFSSVVGTPHLSRLD